MKMKIKNSRLVITGMGAITPIGIGVEEYWENLVAGQCGVEKITKFDVSGLPVKIAAEVKGFEAEQFMSKKLMREMDPYMQYGYAAAMQAIEQTGEAAEPGAWGLSSERHSEVLHRFRRRRTVSVKESTRK